ncbi:MAG: TolC family protein, partial [Cytophagales bacterium]|nr:TolC family protein [Cytophagales bacterium]
MRLITIIILGLCSQAFELRSQGVLEGYIKTGLENNQQLIREQLATQLQYQVEREARGGFMPNVSFDASYIWAEGGRLISVPAGDLVNPAYQGLNEILGENRFPTDIENVDEQLLPNNFHETKIRLIQPLLNSSIYYNYKAQSAQYSAQRARQQAYENQLVREIKVGYYKHLSALEKLDILLDTRELLEELLRVSKKLVANDKATKEILYASQAEVNKMDSQIAAARKQVNTSRIYFNFLLSRGLNEPILVDTTMISVPQVEALAELDQQA